jgi:hypothetical protein
MNVYHNVISATASRQFRRRTLGTIVAAMLLLVSLAAGTARGQTLQIPDNQVRTSDLIRLATSVADALGELKVAQLKHGTLQRLSASTPITGLEIRVAEIGVATAEQKVGFLREIGKAELAAAEANLEMMKQLWNEFEQPGAAADAPKPGIVRAEADIAILKMILAAK